jgi:dihydroorotate dehydrogenase electron transfer subunit
MSKTTASDPAGGGKITKQIATATVQANTSLCREHLRLTVVLPIFPPARPGQFVQLSPATAADAESAMPAVSASATMPLLPRAFSIGGLRRDADGCALDIIYRVVGVATGWMAALRPGDPVTILGPLGQAFPQPPPAQQTLLIMGGVGMPPLLYFAEELHARKRSAIGFFGAQTGELIPLTLDPKTPAAPDATSATRCAAEFARYDVPLVISTDDGSCGFAGNVVQALAAYARHHELHAANACAYVCGPERMMQAAAAWCADAGITCYLCMERPMACGMGTCQSCIVTVRDENAASGTRYALCCTEGPVFAADRVVWDDAIL